VPPSPAEEKQRHHPARAPAAPRPGLRWASPARRWVRSQPHTHPRCRWGLAPGAPCSPTALGGVCQATGEAGKPRHHHPAPAAAAWNPQGPKHDAEPLHHPCIKNHGSCGAPETKPQPRDTLVQGQGCHSPAHLLPRPGRLIFHHLWQKQACHDPPGPPAPINMHRAGFMGTDGVGGLRCGQGEGRAGLGRGPVINHCPLRLGGFITGRCQVNHWKNTSSVINVK